MENENNNSFRKEKVHSERLIIEVEKRPSIWDSSSDLYSNRQAKRKDWEKLVDMFSEEGFSIEQKKTLGVELQRKWKNLRDSYTRELRRRKNIKTGSATNLKSSYIYFSNMTFLSKCSGGVPTEGDKNKEMAGTKAGTIHGGYDPSNKSSASLKRNKKGKPQFDESDLIATLKSSIESRDERERQAESDHERLFLISLLPEYKKIPEHLKLSTKLEILSIIQQNQTAGFSQGYSNRGYISQQFNASTALPMQHWQNPTPASQVSVPVLSPNLVASPTERTDSVLSVHSMESSVCSAGEYDLLELF